MKKNTKQKIQKKFSRQHLVMTLVLAVALTLGAWLALVMPSELAAANEDAGHMHTFACYEGFELACDDETHATHLIVGNIAASWFAAWKKELRMYTAMVGFVSRWQLC